MLATELRRLVETIKFCRLRRSRLVCMLIIKTSGTLEYSSYHPATLVCVYAFKNNIGKPVLQIFTYVCLKCIVILFH